MLCGGYVDGENATRAEPPSTWYNFTTPFKAVLRANRLQQRHSPRWRQRRTRRPRWRVPRRGGYHWCPECGSTDWPAGRNTRTTGRSTPLVNTQTHRCTNITHWYKQLFFAAWKRYQKEQRWKCGCERWTKQPQQQNKGSPVAVCSDCHLFVFSKNGRLWVVSRTAEQPSV